MATEIERKFVVDELPAEVLGWPVETIQQGYVAVESEVEVRLRRRGCRFFETVKIGTGQVRRELEVELEASQFECLWPAASGRSLEKRRYVGEVGGRTFEVDVYGERLAGLVVVEVEFPDREAAIGFRPPPWFGREVTDDPEYANRNLALG